MKSLLIAFDLLTTIPLRVSKPWQPGDSGHAAGWFSFVGLCIGGIVAAVYALVGLYFSRMLAAALSLGVWVALTGGLHLDGLADCFDGMFYAGDAEKRLQIMKDPNLGAFGTIGLILILLIKFSALSSLSSASAVSALLLSASLARWCSTLAGAQPLARPDGMGADFVAGLKRSSLIVGALIPLVLAIWLAQAGIAAALVGLFATACILFIARKRLGGMTGDVFGMIIEVAETASLIPFGFLHGTLH